MSRGYYFGRARKAERVRQFTIEQEMIAQQKKVARFRWSAWVWFNLNSPQAKAAALLACLLLSGCSTTLLGAAESDCERFVAVHQEAFRRCDLPIRTKADFCSDVIYSDNSEEEIDRCIAWNKTADCQLLAAGEICDLNWTRNPIR